jgi:GT2 family glycosyltransferase
MVNQPSDEYDVTASIVAYKTNHAELEQVVRCCRGSSLRVEIFVVDNSPSDELAFVCSALGIKYVHTTKNVGFGTAHNIAFNNSSTSKYHLVLNCDVQFKYDTLEQLVAFMELNESAGLVMPRVLYPDGSPQKLCKRLPTPFDILARRVVPKSLNRLFQDQMNAFELSDLDMSKVLSVPYLSGCCMLLRKKALRDVGMFDERYFMYFEDLDLTRRIHQRYQTVYYPRATIIHRHERGSHKSMRLLFCGIHSAVQYFNKWGWFWDSERDRINHEIGPMGNVALPDSYVLPLE